MFFSYIYLFSSSRGFTILCLGHPWPAIQKWKIKEKSGLGYSALGLFFTLEFELWNQCYFFIPRDYIYLYQILLFTKMCRFLTACRWDWIILFTLYGASVFCKPFIIDSLQNLKILCRILNQKTLSLPTFLSNMLLLCFKFYTFNWWC